MYRQSVFDMLEEQEKLEKKAYTRTEAIQYRILHQGESLFYVNVAIAHSKMVDILLTCSVIVTS